MTNHHRAKKHLGQNFLTNTSTLHKIVETADVNNEEIVLEVGPGKGVLTSELIKAAKQVICIEKDPDLIPLLEEKFKDTKTLKIIEADVLKTDVPDFPFKVVANIPYYISSPILNHFLQAANKPSSMTLLVQKEVAEKICVKAGNHSILSIQVQLFGEPKLIAEVPASHFSPAPKVESAILHIQTYQEIKFSNPLEILKFAKIAFSQKRKKLRNTLIKSLQLDPENLEEETGISLDRRPETLSLEEWGSLVKLIRP